MGLFFPEGIFTEDKSLSLFSFFPSLFLPVFTVQSLPAAGLKNESVRFLGVGMEVVKNLFCRKRMALPILAAGLLS